MASGSRKKSTSSTTTSPAVPTTTATPSKPVKAQTARKPRASRASTPPPAPAKKQVSSAPMPTQPANAPKTVARVKEGSAPNGVTVPATRVSKPAPVSKAAMVNRIASCGPPAFASTTGGGMGGGGYGGGFGGSFGIPGGGGFGGGGRISNAGPGNFYSPELSTDFLELPQSLDEKRNTFRFFYRTDPFVGQAVDIHVELPLSKIRMGVPDARNKELARRAYQFCVRWADEIGLEEALRYIVHEYTLLGEAFVFCEDGNPDMPEDVTHERKFVRDDETGEVSETLEERPDRDERAARWLAKNYKGWTSLQVIPPERVNVRGYSFTSEKTYELTVTNDERKLVEDADAGEPDAKRIVDSMPEEIVDSIRQGEGIRLNTDPDAGSFLGHLTRKKSQYEAHGHSLLERVLRVLTHRDKLRQAQAQITARHMTPIRIVWVEDGDLNDIEELRMQVEQALMDPDYSIITNYQVNWEEMGSDQRMLDLNGEYDLTDRQMYAGLGVTESLLSGESSYSGDRINLEVINTRYQSLRDTLCRFVDRYLLKPMCSRMGFVEDDEFGNLEVICPRLGFTRLALRDNQDTFDMLFNLYQKGSLDIGTIYEMLNIDPVVANQRLEDDLFTPRDSTFNEVTRGIYGEAGRALAENSDAIQKIAEALGLKYKKKEEEASRF